MANEYRRFQVFVSSTYLDLREARQQVTMTLLECDAFPTGMEIFPAADDDAWTLIKRVIDESDYYLLVSAGKYGSVDATSGLSYTEMEYDYAVSAGKPVMAFLYRNPGELKAEQCENTDEMRERLNNFREKVRKARHVKLWKSPDELAGQVALTYNKFVRQYPATGWVRADQVATAESLKELLAARSRIEELEAELKRAQTSAPAGTDDLAQGDDEFELAYHVSGTYPSLTGYPESFSAWADRCTTWDSLFAAVAPILLQEAEENAMRDAIGRFLASEYLEDNIQLLLKAVRTADPNRKGTSRNKLRGLRASVDSEEFGTIIVQLTALGLIERSERKRSVNDTGTYWTLTRYGETRTIQLRALRKDETKALTPNDAAEVDDALEAGESSLIDPGEPL